MDAAGELAATSVARTAAILAPTSAPVRVERRSGPTPNHRAGAPVHSRRAAPRRRRAPRPGRRAGRPAPESRHGRRPAGGHAREIARRRPRRHGGQRETSPRRPSAERVSSGGSSGRARQHDRRRGDSGCRRRRCRRVGTRSCGDTRCAARRAGDARPVRSERSRKSTTFASPESNVSIERSFEPTTSSPKTRQRQRERQQVDRRRAGVGDRQDHEYSSSAPPRRVADGHRQSGRAHAAPRRAGRRSRCTPVGIPSSTPSSSKSTMCVPSCRPRPSTSAMAVLCATMKVRSSDVPSLHVGGRDAHRHRHASGVGGLVSACRRPGGRMARAVGRGSPADRRRASRSWRTARR